MTHFATADEPGDDHFPAQLEPFHGVRGGAARARTRPRPSTRPTAPPPSATRPPLRHGALRHRGLRARPVRRGPGRARARAGAVARVLRRGGQALRAGRERRLRAPLDAPSEPTWVGVLPIGYGDGWRRALSNNCDVLVGGRRRPLVGTVSMDNVTVDLGPETDVEPGEPAVLIGAQGGERILCEEVARRLDTINYEITCGLTPRVRTGARPMRWGAGGRGRPRRRSRASAAWLVGGTVRDTLLGRPVTDVDLAVDGDPEATAARALGARRSAARSSRCPRRSAPGARSRRAATSSATSRRLQGDDDRGGPGPARLHRERDGGAARGRRADRPARRAGATSRRAGCACSAPRPTTPTRCARCGWRASPASSASRPTPRPSG